MNETVNFATYSSISYFKGTTFVGKVYMGVLLNKQLA